MTAERDVPYAWLLEVLTDGRWKPLMVQPEKPVGFSPYPECRLVPLYTRPEMGNPSDEEDAA